MLKVIQKKMNTKRENSGAAMVVVICVMAIITVFSLSLLLSAYQMYASVLDESQDDQYVRQASSFSEVMRYRLQADHITDDTTDLAGFIYDFMNDDAAYPADLTDYEYELPVFTPSGTGGTDVTDYGNIKITLTKQLVGDTASSVVETSSGKDSSGAASGDATLDNGYSTSNKEYYLLMKVDVMRGSEVVGSVTSKYDFYCNDSGYNYYVSNDPTAKCKASEDELKVTISGVGTAKFSYSELKNKNGIVSIGGTKYVIIREADDANNACKFTFVGYY